MQAVRKLHRMRKLSVRRSVHKCTRCRLAVPKLLLSVEKQLLALRVRYSVAKACLARVLSVIEPQIPAAARTGRVPAMPVARGMRQPPLAVTHELR